MADEREQERCAFCDYEGPNPILADYGEVYAITPLNPVTKGHILLIPKAHVPNFACGRADIVAQVAAAAANLAIGWTDANLITSKGSAATQTIDHLHFHLIPRREGDGLALTCGRTWRDTYDGIEQSWQRDRSMKFGTAPDRLGMQ